ncbi:hypothetical protein [Acetivibrio clariflavus]|uniref:Uncharacterized protein n=1 Tax=Acetivibrio clariflavus (strain DSM 19732 / NBRC 101661 / EBR45) TaxID=720554 RepID=G8LWU3_ACECE|nr:hypothetical protein [Acetivibrio clariflavus]AEV69804.1 hypothetical protein Clocl_3299 [Acetivibrio clariflavus DSM 19732]
MKGGIVIDTNIYSDIIETIKELEDMERNMCNLPEVFSQILKDEINANDESRLFNGVKRIIKKYSQNKKELEAIDEMIRVLCGGASINEILQVTKDECTDMSLTTGITVDDSCKN